jgi:hypothetical protein
MRVQNDIDDIRELVDWLSGNPTSMTDRSYMHQVVDELVTAMSPLKETLKEGLIMVSERLKIKAETLKVGEKQPAPRTV